MAGILGLSAVSAETRNLEFSFSLSDFTMTETANGLTEIVTASSGYLYHESADPGLPFYVFTIAVPPGSTIGNIKNTASESVVASDIRMAPNPIPLPTDGSVPFREWEEVDAVYPLDEYPVVKCTQHGKNRLGEVDLLHFHVSPFRFNARTGELYFADSIKIEVGIMPTSPAAATVAESDMVSAPAVPVSVMDWALNTVVDDKSVELLRSNRLKNIARSADTEEGDARRRLDYIIITSDSLKSSYIRLAEWKTRKGVPTKIATVESIKAAYPSVSTQMAIKQYLQAQYQANSALKYVLLGGDDTIVPVVYCKPMGPKSPHIIPSDLYYVCYSGDFDWDADKNGIRGEENDEVDFTPYLAISRLPVRTNTDVSVYVDRLLEYELSPKYKHNILMAGTQLVGGDTYYHQAENMGENLFNSFKDDWGGERKRMYNSVYDFDDGDRRFRHYLLDKYMRKGFSFVDVITHGGKDLWQTQAWPYYTCDDALQLVNPDAHTIITTISCDTNFFDSLPESEDNSNVDPCLSEAFIRNPTSGVVAYLGSSRSGWHGGSPDKAGASIEYEKEFYQLIVNKGSSQMSFGIAVKEAKLHKINIATENNLYRYLQFSLNAIGDPEMPVLVSVPQKNHLNLSISGNDCYYSCEADNATLCLTESIGYPFDGDYRLFSAGRNGVISGIPLDFSIVATASGYIPVMKRVKTLQNTTISESAKISVDLFRAGCDMTTTVSKGDVVVSGCKLEIEADEIMLGPGVNFRKGAEVILTSK